MALRNHSSIPEKTIRRVKKIADEIGYVPDPALSALIAHRTELRVRKSHSNIALISRVGWTERGSSVETLKGAKARAIELGYSLQHFEIDSATTDPKRFSKMLKARGIRGIIMAALKHHEDRFDLDWKNYSPVTIGAPANYTLFHHISQNQYANVLLCWNELSARGYDRIGLVVQKILTDRTYHQWEASHAYVQSKTESISDPIPSLILDGSQDIEATRSWLREYRPQAVISRCNCFFEAADLEGLRVPEDIGYISLSVSDDDSITTGIHQHREVMGALAVDILNTLLHRNHQGENKVPVGTLVNGTWRNGKTLSSHPPEKM